MPIITRHPIVTDAPDDFFDFTTRGLRSATFNFEVVEVITGMVVGTIQPLRNTTPTLSHDVTRGVKRTLTLTLGVADTLLFDEITHRVDVSMVTGDGRVFPLGRYMAVSKSLLPTTAGDLSTVALADEMFVLAQKISESFSAAVLPKTFSTDGVAYTNVYDLLNDFLDRYTLFNPLANVGSLTSSFTAGANTDVMPRIERIIEFTNFTSSGSWQTGTDGTTVLGDLALNGDYFTPWMDNDGNFRMIRSFNPDDVVPRFDFDEQENVIRDTITRTNDLLNAPNRIIVVSNAAMGDSRSTPIVGRFDIPASAPHSIAQRGFVIPDVIDTQVMSNSQANAMARNIGLNRRVVERVSLSTPPDPRHDAYDVIRWAGELWLEVGWSMPLVEGGQMTHTMQRIYI